MGLERLKGLFLEVPETKLSLLDAARISELDYHVCRQVMSALVDVRFLTHTADGGYRRRGPLRADEPLPKA
jgi:hypothetical protein